MALPGQSVRPPRIARCLAVLFALASAAPPSSSAQPALPRLDLANLPEAARAALTPAASDAGAHPDDAARVGLLAMHLHAWEQWSAAAEAYARAEALQPSFDWAYLSGIIAARIGDQKSAAGWFAKAVERDPSSVAARLRLADSLFESNDLARSAELYTALISVPDAEPHARYGLGRTLAAQDEHKEAIAQLRRAVELYPRFAAAWYAIGLSLRREGDVAGATDALARAREYGAEWPAVDDPLLARVRGLRDDGRARLEKGIELGRGGDVAGAIREHEAALEASPDLIQAHVNLIGLYGRAGNIEKARAHYQAVIASGTSLSEAHYNFGVLLMQTGHLDEATNAFRSAAAANPLHAGALTNLAYLAERRGDLTEAAEYYSRAVDAAPADAIARFNLGRMQLALKRYDEAAVTFERLSEQSSPERARYLFGLATARVQAGRVADGLAIARQAREEAAKANNSELVAAIDRELARLR
jgi:Tfp pilus assembly protein PilF